MVKTAYNFDIKDENKIAKAIIANANASLKYSTEICREIKSKPLNKAEKFLMNIIEKEQYLPLRKYNKKVPHRKGNATSNTKSGRYPQKTAKIFLDLLGSAKANADYKGLNSDSMLILHAFASEGFRRQGHQSQGRISGKIHKRKSTHLEVILSEMK